MQRLIGKQNGDVPHNPACTMGNSNQLCIFGTQVKSRLSRWDHTGTIVMCQATSPTLPANKKGKQSCCMRNARNTPVSSAASYPQGPPPWQSKNALAGLPSPAKHVYP